MLIKGRILIGHAISNDTDVRILANVRSLSSHRHLDRRSSSSPILVPTPATQQSTLLSRASQRPSDQVSRHSPSSSSALTFKAASTAPCVSLFHFPSPPLTFRISQIDDARATMAIYRSQKTAWEDALRTHTKPTLVTSSTPSLASLDLLTISMTGVKKSGKPKTLGLAATLRHARHEAEVAEAAGTELGEEELELRERKKRRREEEEDVVLGFDYEVPKVVVRKEEVKKVKVVKEVVKKVKKVMGRAFKGDREKRPKSKEGWWDDG